MKYEFASPGWMAFMHGMIAERLRRLESEAPGLSWSICEVFTDPPRRLSPDGSPLAWTCIVERGVLVAFETEERDDVEFKVFVDYETVVPLGRFDTRGEPERAAQLAALAAVARESGRMKVIGDRSKRDPRIGDFHDAIAKVTA